MDSDDDVENLEYEMVDDEDVERLETKDYDDLLGLLNEERGEETPGPRQLRQHQTSDVPELKAPYQKSQEPSRTTMWRHNKETEAREESVKGSSKLFRWFKPQKEVCLCFAFYGF